MRKILKTFKIKMVVRLSCEIKIHRNFIEPPRNEKVVGSSPIGSFFNTFVVYGKCVFLFKIFFYNVVF